MFSNLAPRQCQLCKKTFTPTNPGQNHCSVECRFFDKVEKGPDCWEWKSATYPVTGYGSFRVNGSNYSAHRFSYSLAFGPIPNGLCVMHTCDNPSCVNPSHLVLGTHKENSQDMVAKGRNQDISGENNPMAKLTEATVVEIQQLLGDGHRIVDISSKFGIPRQTIQNIKSGSCWSTVDGTEEMMAKIKKRCPEGSPHPNAKLTNEDVIKIRHLLDGGTTGVEIAGRFNISRATVSFIKNGVTWTHI